ncbi:MAG TPA: hypothetical protein DCG54_09775 [Anaerolineae bacterium]|jgi:hypothetical protein|nr:hypothetical protein [Anaerolineae bacterium]
MQFVYCKKETKMYVAPDTSVTFFKLTAGSRREVDDLLPNDQEPEWVVILDNKQSRYLLASEVLIKQQAGGGLADLRGLILRLVTWAAQYGFKP